MKDEISKTTKIDRRIKARHSAPCLEVTIRPSGLLKWLKSPIDVKCIDINRYGMAVESTSNFRIKEKIIIDFKGKYISQSNVVATITATEKHSGVYRLGITFNYSTSNKQYSKKVDDALSRIERLYNERYSVVKKAG